jgi:hypothetical protein
MGASPHFCRRGARRPVTKAVAPISVLPVSVGRVRASPRPRATVTARGGAAVEWCAKSLLGRARSLVPDGSRADVTLKAGVADPLDYAEAVVSIPLQ